MSPLTQVPYRCPHRLRLFAQSRGHSEQQWLALEEHTEDRRRRGLLPVEMEEWPVRCIPFNRRWLIESSCRTLWYLQTYESDAVSFIKAKHLSILLVKLKCSYRMIVVSRMTACFRYMAPLAIKVGLHACFRYMAPLAIKVGLHACFRYMAPLAIKVGLHASGIWHL